MLLENIPNNSEDNLIRNNTEYSINTHLKDIFGATNLFFSPKPQPRLFNKVAASPQISTFA